MKRLHQALGSENTYGQVAYNYDDQDSQTAIGEDSQSPKPSDGSQEEDQAFVLPPELEAPEGTILVIIRPPTLLKDLIVKGAECIHVNADYLILVICSRKPRNSMQSSQRLHCSLVVKEVRWRSS